MMTNQQIHNTLQALIDANWAIAIEPTYDELLELELDLEEGLYQDDLD